MKNTFTLSEAIEQEYQFFVIEDDSELYKLIDLQDDEYLIDNIKKNNYKCYLVDHTKYKYYNISKDEIKNLIVDYVAEQQDFADENEKLVRIAEKFDYAKFTNQLNRSFKEVRYFEPTDKELIV